MDDLMSQFILRESSLLVDKLKRFRLNRFLENALIVPPFTCDEAKELC